MAELDPADGYAPHTPLPRGLVWLVAGIALIEVVLSLADRGLIFDPTLRPRVYAVGAFWTQLLRGDEPIFAAQPVSMFITHALLHGGFLHMAMNMTILLALGKFAADRYGPGIVLPLFGLGAIGGGAAFGLIAPGAYPMVGASGAVFAFLGLWIAWDWRRHRTHGVAVGPVMRRVLALAGINLLMYVALGGLLAWEAHLGGFLVGLAVGGWLEGRRAALERAARAAARQRHGGAGH